MKLLVSGGPGPPEESVPPDRLYVNLLTGTLSAPKTSGQTRGWTTIGPPTGSDLTVIIPTVGTLTFTAGVLTGFTPV